MPTLRTCRECGASVAPDAPLGHCATCLIQLGLSPGPADGSPPGAYGQFGEYELLEQIGQGGMGVVFRARQISLNRFVALKMLNPHASAFPGVAERLRLEAETAATLHHPHIVTIHDVGEQDGRPFFSMELIEGNGMDKCISASGFVALQECSADEKSSRREPLLSIARVMKKIARAVDYAHKHGVLHRDLKPANVLIDSHGEPHLTDFGLAKILGRTGALSTVSGAIMGTPAYMAPEQAAGDTKRVSTAADIYSLGAILYEMLTGRPPFRAETPLETLRHVVEREPKHPSTFNGEVDQDLATICLKCLQKDPARRFGTALDFAEDIERWLRGEPIEARPVRPIEKLWRWCRKDPLIAGMAAGLALLLIATTMFALIAYRASERQLLVSETQRQRDLKVLFSRIDAEWRDPNRRFVRLPADELDMLSGQSHIRIREGTEQPIMLGVHLTGYDDGIRPKFRVAASCSPLVNYLQTNVVSPQMVFDVCLYKSASNAVEGLLRGEVNFSRLSASSILLARRKRSDLLPLVVQEHGGQTQLRSAIFTHTNSGILRLDQLKGHSFAFANVDSDIGCPIPKAELLTAGLHARDLAATTNCASADAIRLVRERSFDAGAADWEGVADLIKAGAPLRILQETHGLPAIWVATGALDAQAVAALRQSLLSLQDTEVLAAIERDLTGFRTTSSLDYQDLERKMEKARLFDQ